MGYEIKISVRNLVEFLLRSGDLDDRGGGSPEDAMVRGALMHRKLHSITMKDMTEPDIPRARRVMRYLLLRE